MLKKVKNRNKLTKLTGKKFDSDKIRWDLLPMDALNEVAKILTFGYHKYGAHNWRGGMEWSRLYGATYRHLYQSIIGKDYDDESKLLHLAHAACNILFLIEYLLHNIGNDDRFIYKE